MAHEIPGAGWLTKSLSRNSEETEVVILVSPVIVRDRIPGIDLWEYPDSMEMLGGLMAELPSRNQETVVESQRNREPTRRGRNL